MTPGSPPADAQWKRCLDCVPFQQLAVKVEALDSKVDAVRHDVRDLQTEFKLFLPIREDVQRVVKFLYGNGKVEDGFAHRFLNVEVKMTAFDRFKWIVVGALSLAALGGLGAIILDAAGRGILGP